MFDPRALSRQFEQRLEALVTAGQASGRAVVLVTFAPRLRRGASADEQREAAVTAAYYMPYMSIEGLGARVRGIQPGDPGGRPSHRRGSRRGRERHPGRPGALRRFRAPHGCGQPGPGSGRGERAPRLAADRAGSGAGKGQPGGPGTPGPGRPIDRHAAGVGATSCRSQARIPPGRPRRAGADCDGARPGRRTRAGDAEGSKTGALGEWPRCKGNRNVTIGGTEARRVARRLYSLRGSEHEDTEQVPERSESARCGWSWSIRTSTAFPHVTGVVREGDLEHQLRQVDRDRRTMHVGSSFRVMWMQGDCGTSMPFKSREESYCRKTRCGSARGYRLDPPARLLCRQLSKRAHLRAVRRTGREGGPRNFRNRPTSPRSRRGGDPARWGLCSCG